MIGDKDGHSVIYIIRYIVRYIITRLKNILKRKKNLSNKTFYLMYLSNVNTMTSIIYCNKKNQNHSMRLVLFLYRYIRKKKEIEMGIA